METLAIMFDDLTPEAQKEVLTLYGVDDPSELNAEFSPIFVLSAD